MCDKMTTDMKSTGRKSTNLPKIYKVTKMLKLRTDQKCKKFKRAKVFFESTFLYTFSWASFSYCCNCRRLSSRFLVVNILYSHIITAPVL